MGKAPSAPDPGRTAMAQTASNRETAIAQTGLNSTNQITPYGNLNYSQIGTWSDGTPRFQAEQTLSSAGQQLLNTSMGTQQNLANLAQEQSGKLSGILNKPLDWSAQQNYLNDLTAQNLNPQWDRLAQQNETDLVNRGMRPGSTAYNDATDQFRQSRSSAYNNANLSNFSTALQSQMALADRPLNQILALSGQGQVQQPNFVNAPQSSVAGTDVAGIANAGYQQQMAGYNAGQQTLGGLFSAGASLIPLLSDRRAKKDIVRIGQTDSGVPIYKFSYKHGGPTQIGYIAQDLLESHPEAVTMGPDGFYRVCYDKVG